MSTSSQKYVLDANAFIQAKRRYYGFDFCPGYWALLKWHNAQGTLCSIDKVHDELKKGGDDLSTWAKAEFGDDAFASTAEGTVAIVYGRMLAWVMAQTQFLEGAKAQYQSVADGWLAAFAKAHGYVVVTLEEYDPVIRKNVPLPNVCRAFDVESITPFEMLRRLEARLSWSPNGASPGL